MSYNQNAALFAEHSAFWRQTTDVTVSYTVIDDHSLQVTVDYQPTASSRPLMPKFGMRM